jgi:hypothetical protein
MGHKKWNIGDKVENTKGEPIGKIFLHHLSCTAKWIEALLE